MRSNAHFILSVAYKRAYDHVSGKCASYFEILLHSRKSNIQFVASMLVPKSMEEIVEVICDNASSEPLP